MLKINEGENTNTSDNLEVSHSSPFSKSGFECQENIVKTRSDQDKDIEALGAGLSQLYLSMSPKQDADDFNYFRQPKQPPKELSISPFQQYLSCSRNSSATPEDPNRLYNQLGFYSPQNLNRAPQSKHQIPVRPPRESVPAPDFEKDPLDMCVLRYEQTESQKQLMPIISAQCLNDLLQEHVTASGIISFRPKHPIDLNLGTSPKSNSKEANLDFARKVASKRFNKWEDLNPDLSCIADEAEEDEEADDDEDSDEMESNLGDHNPDSYLAKRRSELILRGWDQDSPDLSNPRKQETDTSWIISSKMFAKRQSLHVPSNKVRKTSANISSENPIRDHPLRESVLKNLNLDCCLLIIDCRYPYEHKGGHLRYSINIKSQFVLAYLFKNLNPYLSNKSFLGALYKLEGADVTIEALDFIADEIDKQQLHMSESFCSETNHSGLMKPEKNCIPVVIFHCEFSSERAPKMWSLLRKIDRNILSSNHTDLEYYQAYVLAGGFREYYEQFKGTGTVVGGYISMEDQRFQSQMAQEDRLLRQDRTAFSKAFPSG